MSNKKQLMWPGNPYPLGATWDGNGVNFTLFADNATGVELCFFDTNNPSQETARYRLTERTHQIWHLYLPGLTPGQLYGYRVYGPYEPENGHRFNPTNLLLDPYAKAIAGTVNWDDAIFGYEIGHPEMDLSYNETDSAPFLPKSVVIDSTFNWEGDRPPLTPLHQTIIYEMHVKGFTMQHPRHLCRVSLSTRHRISAKAGRHCRGTDARPPICGRSSPGRTRIDQLLGLQLDWILCARFPLRQLRGDGRAGARV
jgi:glycogen operon protein